MKNVMLKSGLISAVFASVLVSGCASIVHGDQQEFKVKSQPNHALVSLDGREVGATPVKVKVSRKEKHNLTISLPGYQTTTLALRQTISGWFIANIFIGGLIGIAIDAVDGAMYELTPEQAQTYAAQGKIKYNSDKNTITVFLVHSADKNWKKIGTLKKK